MPASVPLRVPVELRPEGSPLRWFRLCCAVSPAGLLFSHALPESLTGRVSVRFHLPDIAPPVAPGYPDDEPPPGPPLSLLAQVVPVDPDPDDEHARGPQRGAELRALRFLDPDGPAAERLAHYAAARPWI